MEYVNLGNSGLNVSRLCLGCMGFGDVNAGWLHKWVVGQEETNQVVKYALDNGINFFDTANIYSLGTSEQMLGKAIKKYVDREEVVIATKVYFTNSDKPNSNGLSRKAIMREVDKSLDNLGMEYIDLLIIHRWDYNTPIEETMKALHDVVESGKVRYIGASAMYGWQFQKAQYIANQNGWTKFISMQNHYNLVYREDERELIEVCKDMGVSLTPYSPLASGKLVKLNSRDTMRSQTDMTQRSKYDTYMEMNEAIKVNIKLIADKYEVSMAQIAIAWLLHKNGVASPIIGSTKITHLEDGIKALDIKLTDEDISLLEKEYHARDVTGAL